MKQHSVLRIITKIFTPFILMFALYVQLHGEYSPGGGFQAGIILAAAVILYSMLFGLTHTQRRLSPAMLRLLCAGGVLLYAGVGVAAMLLGGNFLDYDVLAEDPVEGQKLGILLIELGVGLTVCSAMILIFYSFAGVAFRGEQE